MQMGHKSSLLPHAVSTKQLCQILAGYDTEPLSAAAITKFVADGMPKAGRGAWDGIACARWYIDRLRKSRSQRMTEGADGRQVSLDEVDIRLKTAKAEAEEMTLAERRGELIPLHAYESQLTHIVQITKQRILNIPSRLGPKLEGCTSIEIKALLTASLKDALTEIARKGPIRQPSIAVVSGKVRPKASGKPGGEARRKTNL